MISSSPVAVIMSVYRGDKISYLRESLNSLYSQSVKVDIFIQQDGWVEDEVSLYLNSEYQKGHIAYMGVHKKNMGLAYSLNQLLEIVLKRGYRYIARMDADDIAMPYRMEKQLNFMETHKAVDVVGGAIEEFGDDVNYQKTVQYPLAHEEMYRFFAKRVPVAHVTAFFRRRFFEKTGLYPTTSPTNEDTLLWMKGFQSECHFANLPDVLVRVRVSQSFFNRRRGIGKAWGDLKDRILVIQTLGYYSFSYVYAFALFMVNLAPAGIKKFLYKRLR